MLKRATVVFLWALLLVPAGVEILGFRSAHLLSQEIWSPQGLHHLGRYSILFAVATLPVAIVFRRYLLAEMVAVIVIGSAIAVGPVAPLSVLAFIFSATVLGRLVLGRTLEARLAFMAGLALWIVALTVTARLPIHYAVVYWSALLLPLLLSWPETRRLASEWLELFRPHPITWPETLSLLLFSFVLVAHWLIVLKPEASTDALATHLAIPMSMARYHVFNFDFRRYVWALTPLGTDLCYSVLFILGGEYAARLMNFALLTATATLIVAGSSRIASRAIALFVAALFISTPIVQLVTGSLFVENFVAAVCLAGVVALWRYRETRATNYLLLAAVLLGTAISLKLAAFAVVMIAIPFLFVPPPKPRLALAAASVLITIGSIPYAIAWRRSGNPIFPYANSRFHSPYVDDELVDARFHPPLSLSTPARLTINTHDYYEGQDGTFGFQYLLLLPLTLAYVVAGRSFIGRSAAVVGIGGAFIIALTQPNARYFYALLPFLTLAGAAVLSWIESNNKALFGASMIAAVSSAAANIYFLPASNYHHRDFYSSPLFKASGRREYLETTVPVREVVAFLNRTFPGETVFYAEGSQIAGLEAPVYRNAWHDYAFMNQVYACKTPRELYVLLQGLGVRHMIVDDYATDRHPPLARIIASCAKPEYRLGNFLVFKFSACEPAD